MAEGEEGIPGYERRIVIMGQGLARTWHVQTPERSLLGCNSAGEGVHAGAE